jgi:hypothetical protein
MGLALACLLNSNQGLRAKASSLGGTNSGSQAGLHMLPHVPRLLSAADRLFHVLSREIRIYSKCSLYASVFDGLTVNALP